LHRERNEKPFGPVEFYKARKYKKAQIFASDAIDLPSTGADDCTGKLRIIGATLWKDSDGRAA
jgi:hypothetical protein